MTSVKLWMEWLVCGDICILLESYIYIYIYHKGVWWNSCWGGD